ncbi:MAG: hypothetical protein FI685_05635 [SAR202 cluster bacterium]|jgi:NTP pyrophosphatase (non-canonical NTP hydrolase)|nr:hypothetical protein [Chloroflexota bacterium]MDP7231256.1 MazG nucleotide pyrophosphohydrolase domain-containing protein [Dehalococcoidia bacterium]MDP7613189.1 MazG nucleotide pyrophosphohydrolase domain-containing protein [Dehalococcoidia bacterium]MQG47557.1 hypothetical protein [SAR202 cluster bacterium]|tara:strand:- start:963 stop:1403 length:441 start_codon:yes stop_codon:yes gene_type:complete
METSHSKKNKSDKENYKNIVEEEAFVNSMATMAREVWKFHDRFGLGSGRHRHLEATEILTKRKNILDEELNEMEIEITSNKQYETLLELADVLFVVMGHVESTGKAGIDAVESVTKKNSQKTIEKYTIRKDTGKLLPVVGKPHKWK